MIFILQFPASPHVLVYDKSEGMNIYFTTIKGIMLSMRVVTQQIKKHIKVLHL